MAYGPSLLALYRQLGVLASKLLRGGSAANVPVETASKFDFVLNLRTGVAWIERSEIRGGLRAWNPGFRCAQSGLQTARVTRMEPTGPARSGRPDDRSRVIRERRRSRKACPGFRFAHPGYGLLRSSRLRVANRRSGRRRTPPLAAFAPHISGAGAGKETCHDAPGNRARRRPVRSFGQA
jgi:hypothetical protein